MVESMPEGWQLVFISMNSPAFPSRAFVLLIMINIAMALLLPTSVPLGQANDHLSQGTLRERQEQKVKSSPSLLCCPRLQPPVLPTPPQSSSLLSGGSGGGGDSLIFPLGFRNLSLSTISSGWSWERGSVTSASQQSGQGSCQCLQL